MTKTIDLNTMNTNKIMKKLRFLSFIAGVTIGVSTISAQPAPGFPPGGGMQPMIGNAPAGPGPVISPGNSLPGPGTGSNLNPGPNPGPAPQAPPPAPSVWGSPWWNGWNPSPTVTVSPSVSVGNLNNGKIKVIACGYDAMGVWRVLPLYVSYNYNGINYNVTVLNAWDPWTDLWNRDVDVQAFSTNYTLRGVTYNYYVVLSFGTFYFNL